jgi:hypothetical protein
MSLAVAVPCGIAAAIAYGASTAAQHAEVHTGAGEIDAQGLVAMLHNPRWLLAMAGDGVGLLLQVIALSTGPVVLIQPLLILAVPWLTARRPPAYVGRLPGQLRDHRRRGHVLSASR